MKKKILVTRNLLPENEERIKKLFDVKLNKQEKLYTSEEILELSKDCNGILCIGGNKFDADIFSKISSTVKIIASYSVGYNNIYSPILYIFKNLFGIIIIMNKIA